jgi:hypothetical protein
LSSPSPLESRPQPLPLSSIASLALRRRLLTTKHANLEIPANLEIHLPSFPARQECSRGRRARSDAANLAVSAVSICTSVVVKQAL